MVFLGNKLKETLNAVSYDSVNVVWMQKSFVNKNSASPGEELSIHLEGLVPEMTNFRVSPRDDHLIPTPGIFVYSSGL